jgi:hypothetical protein
MVVRPMSLFIERSNDRKFAPDFTGNVYAWDIDKTYLDTHFSSWRGLLSIPLEFAVDKRAMPGAVPLLRALRRGPGEKNSVAPLYFVSGSPPQLRSVIQRKMILDGVEFDGITFKDQWGLVRAGRSKEIKEQIGYKVTALLLYQQEIPTAVKWIFFGDDFEADHLAFSMFGEVMEGLRGEPLADKLTSLGVSTHRIEDIRRAASVLPVIANPVEHIFIQLVKGVDPSKFQDARIVASRSFLQSALFLAMKQKIKLEYVAAVAADLRHRMIEESVINAQLDDAKQRLLIPEEILYAAKR